MRRLASLLAVVLPVTLVVAGGCARPTGPGNSVVDPPSAGFEERARAVAAGWRTGTAGGVWRTGFVPLQDLTAPPPQGFVDGGLKQAFLAGWYRLEGTLPSASVPEGTIRFPDGATLTEPLVPAKDAYAAIDQGDPSCPGGDPVLPPGPGTGADTPTSTAAPCAVLTVTGAALGTTTIRTSRGDADVPAWLFEVRGLRGPVARVAVAPDGISAVPTPSLPEPSLTAGIVGAQDMTAVDGAKLTYRLGVGACDQDIKPLVYEDEQVVVVGGSVTTPSGTCIDLLKLESVTVTLAKPLGARPVVDVSSGRALSLAVR